MVVSPADRERLMLKYYMWAVGEKALSYVPCGRPIYNGLGYLTTRTSKRRLVGCSALPNQSGRLSLTARDLRLSTIMRTSRMRVVRRFARCRI